MSNAHEFDVTISSDISEGQQVQERIIGLLEQLDYSSRDVFSVRLSLEEALVNAIKHGNRLDPDKTVHIECRVGDKEVWISIEDQGEGFVLNDVPDPTLDENLDKPCGRGIMLMRSFMNEVCFNENGNRVTLQKFRDSPTGLDNDD